MSISILNRTYVGCSYLSITRVSDGVVYSFPAPTGFNIATNLTLREQMGTNTLGRKVRTGSYSTGETPELTVSFEYMSPELIAFSIGNELVSGTFDTHYPKVVTVTGASIAGDTATGGILNGLSADVSAVASYVKDGISINLTRQPFATFTGTSPANDDSFAIGADGALKFSNNLVSAEAVVVLKIPVSVTGVKISEVLVGQLKIQAALINTLNEVTIFEANNVQVNTQGKTFDMSGEGSVEVSFFLNNPPGECKSWNIYGTDSLVSCI